MATMEVAKIVKQNGSMEFRAEFGRGKSAVLTKGGDYFYITLYDNRQRFKGNKIFFGMDEMEEIIKIHQVMDTLKPHFYQYAPRTEPMSPPEPVRYQQLPQNSAAQFQRGYKPINNNLTQLYTAQPLHDIQNIQVVGGLKRKMKSPSLEAPPKKKS